LQSRAEILAVPGVLSVLGIDRRGAAGEIVKFVGHGPFAGFHQIGIDGEILAAGVLDGRDAGKEDIGEGGVVLAEDAGAFLVAEFVIAERNGFGGIGDFVGAGFAEGHVFRFFGGFQFLAFFAVQCRAVLEFLGGGLLQTGGADEGVCVGAGAGFRGDASGSAGRGILRGDIGPLLGDSCGTGRSEEEDDKGELHEEDLLLSKETESFVLLLTRDNGYTADYGRRYCDQFLNERLRVRSSSSGGRY
jgi:hypothetical protein